MFYFALLGERASIVFYKINCTMTGVVCQELFVYLALSLIRLHSLQILFFPSGDAARLLKAFRGKSFSQSEQILPTTATRFTGSSRLARFASISSMRYIGINQGRPGKPWFMEVVIAASFVIYTYEIKNFPQADASAPIIQPWVCLCHHLETVWLFFLIRPVSTGKASCAFIPHIIYV